MIRLALIGGGKIGREIYKPAIDLDPESKIVAVCCQTSESLQWWRDVPSVKLLSRNWRDVVANENIDAVIIATPNHLHKSQVVEALNQGKHVLCEKPISTDIEDAKVLWSLAKNSDLTHMTAFTYRFAPAVRYIKHLIEEGDLGAIRHFRSQRFLDLPETSRGWKQDADKAGAGVLFAMLSHRLDYARYWLGDLEYISGTCQQFANRRLDQEGNETPKSGVDDWAGAIGIHRSGCTSVFETSIIMKGYKYSGVGYERGEVNGELASVVYELHEPNRVLYGKEGGEFEEIQVPQKFLKSENSPRDVTGDFPKQEFRFDVVSEFIAAVRERRPASPDLGDGYLAQVLAEKIKNTNLDLWRVD